MNTFFSINFFTSRFFIQIKAENKIQRKINKFVAADEIKIKNAARGRRKKFTRSMFFLKLNIFSVI